MNVNKDDVDNLTARLMKLIDSDNNAKITKKEMQNYTELMVKHVTPNKRFNLEAFDLGFRKLDPEG